VLWTFLSLFALKFLFSQSAQPKLLEKEFSYKNQLDTLMAMSNGNPWNLEISADQLISDGPFDSCRLSITPIIPYQYHYYHYLYTGKILKRDHSRTYRFMRSEPKLLDSYTRVFQFEDKMNNKFMLLAN
jgi:hypothetical protein